MLKELFKEAKEIAKKMETVEGYENYPSLSVRLFDTSEFYKLSQEETRVLLQEAIYLLRDKSETAEAELMEAVEEWHPEHFDEE